MASQTVTWPWEAVPGSTFTPQEPLVELTRVGANQDAILLMTSPEDKPFLVRTFLSQSCADIRENGSISVLIVREDERVVLWDRFLRDMTPLPVLGMLDEPSEGGGIHVTTPEALAEAAEKDQAVLKRNISLIVCDDAHTLSQANGVVEKLRALKQKDGRPPRFVSLTQHFLETKGSLSRRREPLAELKLTLPGKLECSSDLFSTLRFIAFPALSVFLFDENVNEDSALVEELDARVARCEDFLGTHLFSLFEIYGEEFPELIKDISDPKEVPLQFLSHFKMIKREFGLWSAERAAILMAIKIDKLKTMEKHERHFLLQGMVHTEMVRIRKLCDDAFADVADYERIERYSSPKLLRLKSLLLKYKPEHVKADGPTKKVAKAPADSSSAEPLASRPNKPSNPHVQKQYHQTRRRGGNKYTSYDDPDALHGIIFVRDDFIAKVLYHFIKELSRSNPLFSFLSPQYVLSSHAGGGPFNDQDQRKQEEGLRKFRMKECNLLISSSPLASGVEGARCNLVVAFDFPETLHDYLHYKVKAKFTNSNFVVFATPAESLTIMKRLKEYEKIQEEFTELCQIRDPPASERDSADSADELFSGEIQKRLQIETKLSLGRAILYLNRYCAKLPSDTFTRLTPLYHVAQTANGKFVCAVLLPVNSPIKDPVFGCAMPTETLAKRAAAFATCLKLLDEKEVDDHFYPVGKESMNRKLPAPPRDSKTGTTKRRQYYYKRLSNCLKIVNSEAKREGVGEKGEERTYKLYEISMRLECPIPDDQNTRGRKIFRPETARQSFGFLTSGEDIPTMCPFPIYTRSGEVIVKMVELDTRLVLSDEQKKAIEAFHKFTFGSVLRLDKYPMVFDPQGSDSNYLVLPLQREEAAGQKVIDWDFVANIAEKGFAIDATPPAERGEGEKFIFDTEDYEDAVIMPWYRNQDQPQFFYVAEICRHLSPKSNFPGPGFDSFEKYYAFKYKIEISDSDQPLLDVDHTSARLNFLTPRYVNRKGIALPTSSEETKRNKRENLNQKQILVPELCAIHPFRASLWRQAVSLPCVFYRLNSLLVADQLRSVIAAEMRLGAVTLPRDHEWETLNFGWSLSDVAPGKEVDANRNSPSKKGSSVKGRAEASSAQGKKESKLEVSEDSDLGKLSECLISKMSEEDQKLKQKSLQIGTWSNEMAEDNDEKVGNGPTSGKVGDDTEGEEEDDDEEDFIEAFDPNIALPDNLTMLSNDFLPVNSAGGRDWGTGIEQKKFRVGSPTYLMNPNINIPGILSDLDGFSCSSSEEDEPDLEDLEGGGSVRIEFRGNVAEAVEDKAEEIRRLEVISRDKEDELKMIRSLPWQWDETDVESLEEDVKVEIEVIGVDEPFQRNFGTDNAQNEVNATKAIDVDDEIPEDLKQSVAVELYRFESRVNGTEKSLEKRKKSGLIPRDTDETLDFMFDEQPDLTSHHGPSPSLILQALTMSNSNDAINLERLETIGDSFLKYAITTHLYCANLGTHEGKLSHIRSKLVSNVHLYKLGKEKALGERMVANKFEPHDNWLPPCYHVPKDLERALIESGIPAHQWNMANFPGIDQMDAAEVVNLIQSKSAQMKSGKENEPPEQKQEISKEKDKPKPAGKKDNVATFVPYNLLTQQSIPDKSIADCVEALIGAYLISCGPQGALLFMVWLGMDIAPKIESLPPSPLLRIVPNPEEELSAHLLGYEGFEEIIGYSFRDKSYLLQAFTHASYYPNRLTDCYQRLEFLGDAVLDYLITRHLYEDPLKHSPGALTDLRSALVNNTIFASLAVKFEFHKYFKHLSPGLESVVHRFVKIHSGNNFQFDEDFYLVGGNLEAFGTGAHGEDETDEAEDIEVPKALGDVFESVAGAIYLDSGLSLDTVWRVYHRMMKEDIVRFSLSVPKSPIRELLELEPETAVFSKPEKLADGRRVRVTVDVFGKGTFKGVGRNYRIAKCTAAKCALRVIKKASAKN